MSTSQTPEHDPDPRPVFEGDWSSASAQQKGAHGAAVKKWKARHEASGAEAQRGEGAKPETGAPAGDGQPERHADDLRALQAVIDHAPINSDRISAIREKQRILAQVEAQAMAEAHGPLVALHEALSALPPEHRVEALGGLLQVEGASQLSG